ERPRGAHEVLDGATQSKMHLAAEGIEDAEMTGAIGIDPDRAGGNREQPGLRVVRARRENARAKWPLVPVGLAPAPLIPREVRRTGRPGEHATIPGTIAPRRHGEARDPGYDGSSARHRKCSATESARSTGRGARAVRLHRLSQRREEPL